MWGDRGGTARGSRVSDTQEEGEVASFVPVAQASDLEDGDMRAFELERRKVAVANVGGAFHAFDDTCTHLRCPLSEGELEGTTVTCPCHFSQFDVTTGEVSTPPALEPVKTYRTHVEGDALQVEV